jgi:hypothetical protein
MCEPKSPTRVSSLTAAESVLVSAKRRRRDLLKVATDRVAKGLEGQKRNE